MCKSQSVKNVAGVKLAYILPVTSKPASYMNNQGPMAGAFFERNFANGVRLGVEMNYCYSTFSYTYTNLPDTQGFITYSGNSRHFAVPVHFAFNVLHERKNQPFGFYGKMGYMPYMHLSSDVKYEYQTNNAFNKKLYSTQNHTAHYVLLGVEATYTKRNMIVSIGITNYSTIKVSKKSSIAGFPSLSVDGKIGMRL